MHIVRTLKRYNHITVANVMHGLGYRWKQGRRPTNVAAMVHGLPRPQLLAILHGVQNYFKFK